MKMRRVEIDSGKGTNNFELEKKIKEYEEGVDYAFDKSTGVYSILSKSLKKVIWPNDNYPYDESFVLIDKKGKIQSCRFASSPSSVEPYKRLNKEGIEEVLNDIETAKKSVKNIRKRGLSFGEQVSEKFCQIQSNDKLPNSNKEVSWIIQGSLFIAFSTFFLIIIVGCKKRLICQRKSKKNCGSKQ